MYSYDMANYFWRNETQYFSHYDMRLLGYFDLTCLITLLISNAFVVYVLSRKNMTSSMNTIFIHIAIAESLSAITYTPRTIQEFIRERLCSIPEHRKEIWENISLIAYLAAFTFRSIAVWLAGMLAVWRYIAVIHPFKECRWCNREITRKFIILGYIFGPVLTIPIYFGLKVGQSHKLIDESGCFTSNYSIGKNTTIYELQVVFENYPTLYFMTFAFYGLFIKVLPSVALIYISYTLINRLIKVKEERKLIISQQLSKQTDRTTKILVVILILFMIGEVPHGISALLTAYHGPKFYWTYYYYGMEINNSLTYLSECFNFVIYYSMSQKFRKTFNNLFNPLNDLSFDLNLTILTSSQRFVSFSSNFFKR